jgi:hypothetical protein
LVIIGFGDWEGAAVLGFAATYEGGYSISVSGNHAFVAQGARGLEVLDLTDPAQPKHVALYKPDAEPWLTSVENVQVMGDRAYISGFFGLDILDISNRNEPVRLGGYLQPTPIESLRTIQAFHAVPNYIFMAQGIDGLEILDVSNPGAPARIGGYVTPGYAEDVYVTNGIAYVTDGDSLQIIDVNIPTAPVWRGKLDIEGAYCVTIFGAYAYVGTLTDGIVVVDVMDPENPEYVRTVPADYDVYDLQISGELLFVANDYAAKIFEITSPGNPRLISERYTDWTAVKLHVVGNQVYFPAGSLGLRIFEFGPLQLNAPVVFDDWLGLLWEGGRGIKLQMTENLNNSDWQDVPNSQEAIGVWLPKPSGNAHFRLVKTLPLQ